MVLTMKESIFLLNVMKIPFLLMRYFSISRKVVFIPSIRVVAESDRSAVDGGATGVECQIQSPFISIVCVDPFTSIWATIIGPMQDSEHNPLGLVHLKIPKKNRIHYGASDECDFMQNLFEQFHLPNVDFVGLKRKIFPKIG